MTNYKVITNNDENASSNTSNQSKTNSPANNRKRHKPVKGLPKV